MGKRRESLGKWLGKRFGKSKTADGHLTPAPAPSQATSPQSSASSRQVFSTSQGSSGLPHTTKQKTNEEHAIPGKITGHTPKTGSASSKEKITQEYPAQHTQPGKATEDSLDRLQLKPEVEPESEPEPRFPALQPSTTITSQNGKQIETVDVLKSDKDDVPAIVRSATFPLDGIQDPLFEVVNGRSGGEAALAFVLPTAGSPMSRRRSTRSSNDQPKPSDPIFPTRIKCHVSITFDEEEWNPPVCIEDFVWHELDSYEKIKKTIEKHKSLLEGQFPDQPKHEIYIRYASCFVKGRNNQISRRSGESMVMESLEALPDTAIQAICGFIHDYPYQRFDLKVQCDCSAIEEIFKDEDRLIPWPAERKGGFHLAIREQYMKKMKIGKEPIQEKRYLSYSDQQILITPSNVSRILEDDERWLPKLTEAEKRRLKLEILTRPASVLQAVCVNNCIPMAFLHHLLCHEPHASRVYSDDFDILQDEILERKTHGQCEHELCRRYYDDFTEHIHKFFPQLIKPDYDHSKKHKEAVMPLRFTDKDDNLGAGGYSTVKEVHIDPHYQSLSPDLTRTYALKKFNDLPKSKGKDAFTREIQMLLRLARYLPHEHILTHITSWEQNNIHYILYEKAQRNLRNHMKHHPGGDLSSQQVMWFFSQLRGLSDAIRRIHLFHEPDVDVITGTVNNKKTGVVGRHHDIKPENILVFDSPGDLPTFKLSDFGSGKFTYVKVQQETGEPATDNRGTPTYVGPESQKTMDQPMTRPFDMWAFGCVFTELVLWFLGIQEPDGKQRFEDMRLNAENHREEYDYFWQRDLLGFFDVNKAVTWTLDMLDQKCKDMQPFLDLIKLLRQLFVIEPGKRLKALQLFNALDGIVVQLQVDLDQSPDRYMRLYQRNTNPEANTHIDIPQSPPNLAPVDKLEKDVSTTGEGRVRSALDLQRLEEASVALQVPIQGDAKKQMEDVGQQFVVHETSGASHDEETHEDDDDPLMMSGAAQPNPKLTQLVNESIHSLQGKS